MINATNLFETPSRSYRSSESFWTSFLALAVLTGSRSSLPVKLPVFECIFERNGGHFLYCEDLIFDEPIELKNIIVEGSIRPGFLPNINSVPNELLNLKPDILIKCRNSIIIIEVKTIGHSLGEYQKACYDRLKEYIQRQGYSVEIYYLLSAGHEESSDWELLRRQSATAEPAKILLWEKVLQYLGNLDPNLAIMESLGDLRRYYQDERYLLW